MAGVVESVAESGRSFFVRVHGGGLWHRNGRFLKRDLVGARGRGAGGRQERAGHAIKVKVLRVKNRVLYVEILFVISHVFDLGGGDVDAFVFSRAFALCYDEDRNTAV